MKKRISCTHWAVGFILMAGLLAGCGTNKAQATPTPDAQAGSSSSSVVSATGIVVPAQRTTLSLSAPGEVEEVLIAEGDVVQSGQVLVRMKGKESYLAAVSGSQLELLSAQQALKKLNETAAQAKAAAELRLANADKALDKAKDRRADKNYAVGDQDIIDQARANLVLAQDSVDKAEEIFNNLVDQPEDNVNRAYALSALAAARNIRDRAEANLNYVLNKPDKLDVNIAEAEVQAAQAEFDAAQQDYDKVKSGPDPDDLALAQSRIKNAEAQAAAAQSALRDLEIKAPFGGTISKVSVHPGEWVVPSQAVLILADFTSLRVETTDLNEIDMARISVGNPVAVTFDALPNVSVQGQVTAIAPKSSESSGVNYTAVVKLSELPEKLRWGMTAFVDIQVNP